MATTVEGMIEAALFARVKTLATSPALPVAWPNKSFTPGERYVRVTHVPNRNDRLYLESDAPHRRYGLLQLSVFGPKNKDANAATDLAGQVAAHFPTDLEMTSGTVTVSVTQAPDIVQAIAEDAYWHVPIMIRYETFC